MTIVKGLAQIIWPINVKRHQRKFFKMMTSRPVIRNSYLMNSLHSKLQECKELVCFSFSVFLAAYDMLQHSLSMILHLLRVTTLSGFTLCIFAQLELI